ncbi:hypothetical protein AMAG_18147 [Allomyces macrogynus ATCC 38327]|uniref:Protein ARV n=1 Tax=Allomyces macrogynus (strain ATCC 38327) TaxID=578462 RepID=A0A0L0SA48_ALLM3|nr:hypothetical protein AMAG_18147 [Allomyces macrogynus ATCC 38327]|eukprot:KNE59312.1 hypothetical protein AMAG_18147 [Allomyces macrogynus ATCC 38327]
MLLHKPQVYRHVLFNRRGRAGQLELPRHGVDLRVARFEMLVVLFDVYMRHLRMEQAASAAGMDASVAMYATRWATGALAACSDSDAATAWGQQLATLAAPLLSLLPVSDPAAAIQSAMVALFAYTADQSDPQELSFGKDEILEIANPHGNRWWQARNSKGQVGIAPSNYLKLLPTP